MQVKIAFAVTDFQKNRLIARILGQHSNILRFFDQKIIATVVLRKNVSFRFFERRIDKIHHQRRIAQGGRFKRGAHMEDFKQGIRKIVGRNKNVISFFYIIKKLNAVVFVDVKILADKNIITLSRYFAFGQVVINGHAQGLDGLLAKNIR